MHLNLLTAFSVPPPSRLGVPVEALLQGFTLNLKTAMGEGRQEGRVTAVQPPFHRRGSGRTAPSSDARQHVSSDFVAAVSSQHPLVMAAEACAMSLPLCNLPPAAAAAVLEAVDAFLLGGGGGGGHALQLPGRGDSGAMKNAAVVTGAGAASLPALAGSDDAVHLLLAYAALGWHCRRRGDATVPQALIQLVSPPPRCLGHGGHLSADLRYLAL